MLNLPIDKEYLEVHSNIHSGSTKDKRFAVIWWWPHIFFGPMFPYFTFRTWKVNLNLQSCRDDGHSLLSFLLRKRSLYSRTFDHSIVMIPNVRNPQNDASSNSYHVFSFLFPRSYMYTIGRRNVCVYVFIWLSVSNSKYGTDVPQKKI